MKYREPRIEGERQFWRVTVLDKDGGIEGHWRVSRLHIDEVIALLDQRGTSHQNRGRGETESQGKEPGEIQAQRAELCRALINVRTELRWGSLSNNTLVAEIIDPVLACADSPSAEERT